MNARIEIQDIQEETPSITQDVLVNMWERAFDLAIPEAEEETGFPLVSIPMLTWKEVFEDEYLL